jgi:hypothetical protein
MTFRGGDDIQVCMGLQNLYGILVAFLCVGCAI